MAKQASVQECEDYIQQYNIQGILKECIVKICHDRPSNPYKWLREHFDKLERVRDDLSNVVRTVRINTLAGYAFYKIFVVNSSCYVVT